MNVRHPLGVLHSFSIKIFLMITRLFYFRLTICSSATECTKKSMALGNRLVNKGYDVRKEVQKGRDKGKIF